MEPTAIHPGQVLLDEVMRPLGVSRAKLARDIDVPIGRIRAVILGTSNITADMALRLGKHFGTTPELWLKLQSDYDLAAARAGAWQRIEPRIRIFGDDSADAAESAGPMDEAEPEPAPRDEASGDAPPPATAATVDPLDAPPAGEPSQRLDVVEASPAEPSAPEPSQRADAIEAPPEEPPPLELTQRVDPVELSAAEAPLDLAARVDPPSLPPEEELPVLELTQRVDPVAPRHHTAPVEIAIPEPPKQPAHTA